VKRFETPGRKKKAARPARGRFVSAPFPSVGKEVDMIDNDWRERLRGLVVRRELPDGSAELYFPQPHHPDVLSFRAKWTTDEQLREQLMEALRRLAGSGTLASATLLSRQAE
jgi:hypothetical protein